MPSTKKDIAAVLDNIGTLLELKGEHPFKTRAYSNAARTLEGLAEPLEKLLAENRLAELKGFGEALVKKIGEPLLHALEIEQLPPLPEPLPGKKKRAFVLRVNCGGPWWKDAREAAWQSTRRS